MVAFYDYVRGVTDTVPDGYDERGMRLYRHLVYIGATQMLESHFPQLPEALGAEQWQALVRAFVRESRWESHFYGDMTDAFLVFLEQQSA